MARSKAKAFTISLALRASVGASPTTCCLISCCVRVDPPLEEPRPMNFPRLARITALGTTPLCSAKCSSSVATIACLRLSEIASDVTEVRRRSLSIDPIKEPSAYRMSEIDEISFTCLTRSSV